MASEVIVRRAGAVDAGAVGDVLREAAAWLDERGTPMWRTDELDQARITADVSAGMFHLAEIDRRPVGVVKFQLEDAEYLYQVVDALDEVAKETGKTIPQIALNWLLQRPTVSTVIVGARNEEQLRQNLGAIGWNLTKEQVAKLDAASARPPAYPYWHQAGFGERNPFPVAI